MSDVPAVQILMATYNGEKFLAEQLDSILTQTYPNWQLLIRDDGSQDRTVDILSAYQTNHPDRIKVVNDGEGNLGGYTQNFQRLCLLSSASVIAFADQDDIWRPEKVGRSVEALMAMQNKKGADRPLLVHHDFTHVDANKNLIAPSFDKAHGSRKAQPTGLRMPFAAEVHGFSMTVNRPLLDLALPFPKFANGHDSVIACLASDVGSIDFIPEQLADYRRHGNNVSHGTSFAKRAWNKLFIEGKAQDFHKNLCSIFDDARAHVEFRRVCAQSYLDTYGAVTSDKQRSALEQYSSINTIGTLERKRILFNQPGISWKSKLLAALAL